MKTIFLEFRDQMPKTARKSHANKLSRRQSLVSGQSYGPVVTRNETITYVADMSLELRNLTKSAQLPFLTYLLEMVFQEAFRLSVQEPGKGAGKKAG